MTENNVRTARPAVAQPFALDQTHTEFQYIQHTENPGVVTIVVEGHGGETATYKDVMFTGIKDGALYFFYAASFNIREVPAGEWGNVQPQGFTISMTEVKNLHVQDDSSIEYSGLLED